MLLGRMDGGLYGQWVEGEQSRDQRFELAIRWAIGSSDRLGCPLARVSQGLTVRCV